MAVFKLRDQIQFMEKEFQTLEKEVKNEKDLEIKKLNFQLQSLC